MERPTRAHVAERPDTPRYAYLDALRGFAIVGVILTHSVMPGLPKEMEALAAEGARGVQLFFIVSALTLTLSWRTRSGNERRPILDFFVRRLFRIAPMFWLAAAFYLSKDGLGPHYWAPNGIDPWMVLATVGFLHGLHPAWINSVVPGGWSIAVETTFYLTFPVLVSLLSSWTRALWAVLLTILGALVLRAFLLAVLTPSFSPDTSYLLATYAFLWFPNQLPLFCLGIALGHLVGRSFGESRSQSALATSFGLLGAVGLATSGNQVLPGHVIYGFAFAAIIWGLSVVPWRLLVNRATRHLGQISYSAYLTHFAVLSVLQPFVTGIGVAGPLLTLVNFTLTMIATVVVATATHRLIEQPGIAAGKRVVTYLESRGTPLQVAEVTT